MFINYRKCLQKALFLKIKKHVKYSTGAIKPVKVSYSVVNDDEDSTNKHPLPPLIMLHGLFGSKNNWRNISTLLSNDFAVKRKIIVVDTRNHGESPHTKEHSYPHLAEDLKLLLKDMNIKKIAALGHSMGGSALMYFTLTNPNMVEKLIVVDISPFTDFTRFKSISHLLKVLSKIELPKNIPSSLARSQVNEILEKDVKHVGVRMFLLTNLIERSDGSYAWRVNLPSLLANVRENIAKFPDVGNDTYEGPTLFIIGAESDFVSDSDHPKIKKLFPNVQFRKIENVGHWVHSENPRKFCEICADFLKV